MKEYYVIREKPEVEEEVHSGHREERNASMMHVSAKHYDEKTAREAIARTSYTDRAGTRHTGREYWTPEQVEAATASMKFPEGTTKWDKFVAFNSMYFDLCRVLDDSMILKTAYSFYFQDEDAREGKIWAYMQAVQE